MNNFKKLHYIQILKQVYIMEYTNHFKVQYLGTVSVCVCIHAHTLTYVGMSKMYKIVTNCISFAEHIC